jgi:hypothetical protein
MAPQAVTGSSNLQEIKIKEKDNGKRYRPLKYLF